jgi:hypothetical protein
MARDATLTNRAQFFRRLQGCLLHCDETNEKPLGDAPYKIYRYFVKVTLEQVV